MRKGTEKAGEEVYNNWKWKGLAQKEKKMDVKMLGEAEDKRKKWEESSITGKRSEKTNQYNAGEEWITKNGKEETKKSGKGYRRTKMGAST